MSPFALAPLDEICSIARCSFATMNISTNTASQYSAEKTNFSFTTSCKHDMYGTFAIIRCESASYQLTPWTFRVPAEWAVFAAYAVPPNAKTIRADTGVVITAVGFVYSSGSSMWRDVPAFDGEDVLAKGEASGIKGSDCCMDPITSGCCRCRYRLRFSFPQR